MNKVKSQRESVKSAPESRGQEERNPDAKVLPSKEKAAEKASPELIPKVKPPGAPGDDWTHEQLAAHFNARGANLTVRQAGLGDKVEGTLAAVLRQEPSGAEVVAYICKGDASPREIAGSRGREAFTHGRFVIAPRCCKDENRNLALALGDLK